MRKTLVIIPGYKENFNLKGYKEIKRVALSLGYKVILFQPLWNYRTLTNWISDLSVKLKTIENKRNVTILGFSIGAMIALLYASKKESIKIEKLLFCSISPYFSEDLKYIPKKAFKILGSRRMNDFKSTKLPREIQSKLVYMVGENEWNLTINRSRLAFKQIKSKEKSLTIIENTGHNISENGYIKEIIKNI